MVVQLASKLRSSQPDPDRVVDSLAGSNFVKRALSFFAAATAGAVLAAIGIMAAIAFASPPAHAPALGEQISETVTIKVDLSVPIRGDSVRGDLFIALSGTQDDLDIDWSFTGAVNGSAAAAAGKATASWNGSGYQGTLTSIDLWNTEIPQPQLPKSTFIFSMEQVTFIYGFPFFTGQPVPPPFALPEELRLSTLWE